MTALFPRLFLIFLRCTCVHLHDVSVAHLIDESTHPGAGRQQEQSVREEDEVALGELLRNNRKSEVILLYVISSKC